MSGNEMKRVVSGIQPTGGLHLGNLLGAILRWVRMQDEAQCLYFLADLHALSVDVDPAGLRANVREMAAALIASGIDPTKSILFRQSAIPAHAELSWILQGTAHKFINGFAVRLFVAPEPYIGGGSAARVMSLRDGRSKMSKTDPSEQSRIQLTDSDEAIAQKIRKAKTDPEPLPDNAAALDPR